jgi:hypothetical protein
MAVRSMKAAAAFAAAVAVYGLVLRRRARVVRCEAVSERLMAGCAWRDNAVLRRDLEVFRSRLTPLLAECAVVASARLVVDDVLEDPSDRIDPPQEGGSR